MAAWLAYLKSRLILPQPQTAEGEPTADEMATRLRWRLQRLRRDARGGRPADGARPAGPRSVRPRRAGAGQCHQASTYKDTLYDLLTAYATERVRKMGGKTYRPAMAPVLQIEEARERLERMLGRIGNWSGLTSLLPFEWSGGRAPPLGPCEHLARLPGTGARRQGRDCAR